MNEPVKEFDPYNISNRDMNLLASILENYLDEIESVMVFPDSVTKKERESMDEAIDRTKKLIKKLKKNDKSVFKDPDDVNDEAWESMGF